MYTISKFQSNMMYNEKLLVKYMLLVQVSASLYPRVGAFLQLAAC